MFLAPKIKYCLSINDYRIISEHKTFKNYSDVKRNSVGKIIFKTSDGEKLITKHSLSQKKPFDIVVIVPSQKRNCGICTRDLNCDG